MTAADVVFMAGLVTIVTLVPAAVTICAVSMARRRRERDQVVRALAAMAAASPRRSSR